MNTFERFIALSLTIFISPILFSIAVLIRVESKGPAIFWSRRIGILSKEFLMPKFRTMKMNTPQLATHLLENPDEYITLTGKFLRKTSLDELPQLLSIIQGNMSFVGPRPALFNQYDLIQLRKNLGLDSILPGVTGWAQVNGRDEISIEDKVDLEMEYMRVRSSSFNLFIIWLTVKKVFKREDVSH